MIVNDLPHHHAVLIVEEKKHNLATSLWIELSRDPAHTFFNQTVLDIDTAREIISWAGDAVRDPKIAIISFHTATLPAQNALLKVLEEPKENVRFILITSNKSNLIETVLSRVQVVDNKRQGENGSITSESSLQAAEFLHTAHEGRMKLPCIGELLNRTDEEGRKDREGVRGFILSLVEELRKEKSKPEYVLETLELASYAADPSASGKALIEYLALFLPKV
jgi:hypothetical protein